MQYSAAKRHVRLILIPAFLLSALLYLKRQVDILELPTHRNTPRITLNQAQFQAQSYSKAHLGFNSLLADLLWLELLQRASHQELHKDEVSWEFSQINTITSLDKNNAKTYPFGAAFLSVFRRDQTGARLLLEKWVRYFPSHWKAHYLLAYHAFYEQKDYSFASKEMLLAASLPDAPPWLGALGIRLLGETGAYITALQIAIELYPSLSSDEGRERLRKRVRSLKYALMKGAWERSVASYSGRDLASKDLTAAANKQLFEVQKTLQGLETPEDLKEVLSEPFNFKYDPNLKAVINTDGFDKKELEELENSGIYHKKPDKG